MKKKKLLLDRFPSTSISFFCNEFKELDFDIKIITYNSHLRDPIKSYEGELINDFEIARGSFFKDVPWVLENKDLEFFSQYEGIFQTMTSRYALSPSYWANHEISTHVILLCNYWKYKITNKKIDVCFSFFAPHDPSSFSLYLVSKLMKIPYIFIDMPIVAQSIRFLSCSFKYRNLLIRNVSYKTEDSVKKILENYQQKIKTNFFSTLPPFMFKKNYLPEKKKLIDKIIEAFNKGDLMKRVFFKSVGRLPRKIFFKYNRLNWYSDKAIPNWLYLYIEKIKIFRRISKRKKKYDKICSSFEKELLGIKYIYFSAPLSPEGSTIPTALWNRDIKISILKLLSVIPNDWKIVYKANPLQFSKHFLYQFSSYPDWFTSDFYYDLLKTNKVLFTSVDTPSKDLIENSMGVASINGTVSVEGIVLGKHAVIFSPMWYDDLEGVHYCETYDNLKSAVNLMENSNIPEPKIFNAHLSSTSIFIANTLPHKFSENVYKIIIEKFISSYKLFNDLDDRKWSI